MRELHSLHFFFFIVSVSPCLLPELYLSRLCLHLVAYSSKLFDISDTVGCTAWYPWTFLASNIVLLPFAAIYLMPGLGLSWTSLITLWPNGVAPKSFHEVASSSCISTVYVAWDISGDILTPLTLVFSHLKLVASFPPSNMFGCSFLLQSNVRCLFFRRTYS